MKFFVGILFSNSVTQCGDNLIKIPSDRFIFNTLQTKFTPMYVDDGLIEVVGFKNAFHGLLLLSKKGHGVRIAQVRFKNHTFLRYYSFVLFRKATIKPT